MSKNQKNNQLKVIHSNLSKLVENNINAMPANFNRTRFIQNCMAVLMDTEDIERCDAVEVSRVLLKGAFLGLDFFNKECYVVIYKGKPSFQTDYKGEVKLAKKYSINKIKDIYAKVVRKGDEFSEEVLGGVQTIFFKPLPFNNDDILGAFAVVMFEDGSMLYETMSTEEIEKIKTNFSRKSNTTGEYSKAWRVTPGEMYKKTVLRRLCKNIELDFDTIEQRQAFEESSDMDFDQEPKPQQESPLNVYDVEYEVVDDENDDRQPSRARLRGNGKCN